MERQSPFWHFETITNMKAIAESAFSGDASLRACGCSRINATSTAGCRAKSVAMHTQLHMQQAGTTQASTEMHGGFTASFFLTACTCRQTAERRSCPAAYQISAQGLNVTLDCSSNPQ